MRYYGVDFVDLYRGTLTLRKLAVLVRNLPIESAVAKTQGASGFSMLELLTMENGMAGPLNPRHPFNEAEREATRSRTTQLSERAAYYEAQRQAQLAQGVGEGHEGEPEGEDDKANDAEASVGHSAIVEGSASDG